MKKIRVSLFALSIVIAVLLTSGCWNYREVDNLSIVAGVAIDKGKDDPIEMTVEIIKINSGKETTMTPVILSTEGKTVFDAARNLISISGKRLYWSHAKVVVISKAIAEEGISKVSDWYSRDAETREDTIILISEEDTAKEILKGETTTEKIQSLTLSETVENQKSLSKSPVMEMLHYDIETATAGISTVLPAVKMKQIDDKKIPEINGTAVIKDDKLIGFLTGEETKYLNFIRDDIKGGVLVEEMKNQETITTMSLEIFKSKTKLKPETYNNTIKFTIDVDTTVAIDEIDGAINLEDEAEIKKIEQHAADTLKTGIEALIQKMQTEYDADILEFASTLWEDKPNEFKKVRDNWSAVFQTIQVQVNVKMHVENSATLAKTIKEGA